MAKPERVGIRWAQDCESDPKVTMEGVDKSGRKDERIPHLLNVLRTGIRLQVGKWGAFAFE